MAFHFVGEMGPDFSPKMAVKSLTSQQMVRIHQLFRQAKFDDPSGDVSCFYLWIVNVFSVVFGYHTDPLYAFNIIYHIFMFILLKCPVVFWPIY